MDDSLQERVEALERTVADGEFEGTATEADGRLSALESRLDTVESQLDELEAATQALRGYVGNVRAVNDEVERRADAAIARVQALEEELDGSRGSRPASTPDAAPRETQTTDHPAATTGDPTASATDHCRACGRTGQTSPETDGGTSTSNRGDGALVPEEQPDTGTLGRIRELL